MKAKRKKKTIHKHRKHTPKSTVHLYALPRGPIFTILSTNTVHQFVYETVAPYVEYLKNAGVLVVDLYFFNLSEVRIAVVKDGQVINYYWIFEEGARNNASMVKLSPNKYNAGSYASIINGLTNVLEKLELVASMTGFNIHEVLPNRQVNISSEGQRVFFGRQYGNIERSSIRMWESNYISLNFLGAVYNYRFGGYQEGVGAQTVTTYGEYDTLGFEGTVTVGVDDSSVSRYEYVGPPRYRGVNFSLGDISATGAWKQDSGQYIGFTYAHWELV